MDEDMIQVNNAKEDTAILKEYAEALSKAAESDDDYFKVQVLDDNFKLWVEIETNLKDGDSVLPEEIKNNLIKLSKYVEKLTLTKGINMSKSNYCSLANINMQISEGLTEAVNNFIIREEAFSLLKCAIDLSTARESNDMGELVAALDNNMKLWVYIKTLVEDKDNTLPEETKGNLIKLADYISVKTLEIGKNIENINDKALDTMIMTNLQITEGLMANQEIA